MSEGIYTERKIVSGVLVGGPLAGGYYFWRNFKTLGNSRGALLAPIVALVVLAISFAAGYVPPLNQLPRFIFWGLQIGMSYGVFRGYLYPHVQNYIDDGGRVFGWLNTLGVAFICLVITIAPIVALSFVAPQTLDNTAVRKYGRLQHEIQFVSGNLTEIEVGRIAAALTSAGFFDEELQKSVDAEKSGDRFIITVYCNESARQPEAMGWFKKMRDDVQRSFPANPIVVDMVIGTPDDRIARLE